MLVVGPPSSTRQLLSRLSAAGYFCAAAEGDSLGRVAQELRPEVVLLTGALQAVEEGLGALKTVEELRGLPVLAEAKAGSLTALRSLGVDELVRSRAELVDRLEAAIRAKRLVEREQLAQRRVEALLEITQAATRSLELEEILSIAVEKIGRIVAGDRCSVVIVEGQGPRTARVVVSRGFPGQKPLQIDLSRYPELRRALETRSTVVVEDVQNDPLVQEVRTQLVELGVTSIMVQPLVFQDDLFGALFLRMSRTQETFRPEDREFSQAAAAALANSIRNAGLHAALRRKREELESAYVDRYRELLDTNARLKEVNRRKDELLAVCSHDLRSPLQVLLGHAKLLSEGGLPKERQGSVDAIERMGRKILMLVEDLLDGRRGEPAHLSLETSSLDLSVLSLQACAELEILATQKNVRLRAEAPESLRAFADELKLRQVLQNLITNALSHAKGAGQVVVRAFHQQRPDGDVAKISVEDDGEGLPKEKRAGLFERRQSSDGGAGLGLSICKAYVELHGGEIWVEDAAGGGCAFVFTVPLENVQPKASGARPAASPRCVLVVEDEPALASTVSEVLRSRYRVEIARDGEEGLAKARALKPDLVLMDVFLPRLDGLDAASALARSADTAEIPVILVSADQGVAEKVRALGLGPVDYMAKPFGGLELLGRVDRAIQLREAQRELARSRAMLRGAQSDPETGLLDRAGLCLRLEQELARSRRYGRPLTVALLEPAEPLAGRLRSYATQLRMKLRAPDVVGHVGGGRFVVLLVESALEAAHGATARISRELEEATRIRARFQLRERAESISADSLLGELLGD